MHRLAVIIPVMSRALFEPLYKKILENSVLPDLVVVIDNTKDDLRKELANAVPTTIKNKGVMISVWRPDAPPIPTNIAWSTGFYITNEFSKQRGEIDFVSVFNDDISIGSDFFKKVKKILASHQEAGAVCPYTITAKNKGLDKPDKLHKMIRKEGWAFTIRKKILDGSPPFPEGCEYFFGDNWLWWSTYRGFGKVWLKDPDNVIYHHVGKAISKLPNYPGIKKKEKVICEKAVAETFLIDNAELTET